MGDNPCLRPEDADTEVPVGEDRVLVLRGRVLAAEDQRLLTAFATQVAVADEQRRLAETAEVVGALTATDRVRTALLNAVSHDLRTPIASAKAAVSSLRSQDVTWIEQDRQELLASADDALDRLTALITNLLDLSRLQAGVLTIATHPVAVEDVVSGALDHAARDAKIDLDMPPDLPAVLADPGLFERAIANLVENAVRYSPPGERVRRQHPPRHRRDPRHRPRTRIRPADREAVAPFQRPTTTPPAMAKASARPGDRPRLPRGHARQRHAGRRAGRRPHRGHRTPHRAAAMIRVLVVDDELPLPAHWRSTCAPATTTSPPRPPRPRASPM